MMYKFRQANVDAVGLKNFDAIIVQESANLAPTQPRVRTYGLSVSLQPFSKLDERLIEVNACSKGTIDD